MSHRLRGRPRTGGIHQHPHRDARDHARHRPRPHRERQRRWRLRATLLRRRGALLNGRIQNVSDSLGENNDHLIVLLGNKVDLVNANPDSRDVTIEEAQNLCKEKNIYWGEECSAKDFSDEELKDIFTKYTQEIYKKIGVNIAKGEMVTKTDDNNKKKKIFLLNEIKFKIIYFNYNIKNKLIKFIIIIFILKYL